MKRYTISLLFAIIACVSWAADKNFLTIDNVSTTTGTQSVMIPIKMTNTNQISDMQFDLVLPTGFSIDMTPDGNYDIQVLRSSTASHDISCKMQSDGSVRILCTSASGAVFSGASGHVLNIKVKVAPTVVAGTYNVALTNVVLSNAEATYTSSSPTSTITIQKTATLTFKLDGEVLSSKQVVVGSPIVAPEVEERTGYTFSGWGTVPTAMPAEDVTISGSFTINQYSVTFKVDGEVYQTLSLDYGSKITIPQAPTKEGHVFSGWTGVEANVPARDLTYEATFSKSTYVVKYMVDGATYKTLSLNYGDSITVETYPTKEGYTFSGWDNVPKTVPAGDVTISGSFTINQYSVTFKVDGEVYQTLSLDYGSKITIPQAPTKEGHVFSGWTGVEANVPARDLTYEATFSKSTYVVKYMVDGAIYKTLSLNYGDSITVETYPTKEGYTFSGWDNVPKTVPAGDVTISGSFTINQYTITFKVDGEVYQTLSLDYGSKITIPQAPTKEGHVFSGWTGVEANVPARDLTYEATFSKSTYVVKYMVDGAIYKTLSLNYGDSITVEANPTKEGYTFSGWDNVPKTVPAGDVTISGSFTINQYSVTFKVDGEVYQTLSLDYGSKITIPQAPTKEGYVFSGWTGVEATVPARDLTYEASFSKGAYVLRYVVDGVDYKTIALDYGDSITVEANPVKEGYTFSGWDNVYATMPANDVTITGSFTINQYTISFKVDSTDYKTFTLDYGSSITQPEAPVKEGYTFVSWGEVAATVPATDVTYFAIYSVNSYKLTFIVDGEIYQEDMVEYGDTITIPATDPVKTGYTFEGWGEVPATMPAGDLTFTAQFEQSAVPGDVNNDGKINAADVVAIYTYITEGESSGITAEFADVNNDQKVNAADVTAVYNIIAGN